MANLSQNNLHPPFNLFLVSCILIFGFVLFGCGVDQGVKTVSISPSSLTIGINRTQQFYATALDASNTTLSRTFTWAVEGSIGSISSSGLFSAGSSEASGYVVASTDNVTAKSAVSVTTKGAISGRVRNQLGANVSNIIVFLTHLSTLSATTNTSGNYTISDVPAGTQEVKTRENVQYLATTAETFVVTGETTTLNITLRDRLSIENENISGNPITVAGNVRNNGTTEAATVSISYLFYDSEGTLTSSAVQSLGNISASTTRSFSLIPAPPISTYSSVTKTVSAASF